MVSTYLKNMLVNLGSSSPIFRDENKKYLKPPTSYNGSNEYYISPYEPRKKNSYIFSIESWLFEKRDPYNASGQNPHINRIAFQPQQIP